MNEWINEWTNESMNEWMNIWMNEWMNGWINVGALVNKEDLMKLVDVMQDFPKVSRAV